MVLDAGQVFMEAIKYGVVGVESQFYQVRSVECNVVNEEVKKYGS